MKRLVICLLLLSACANKDFPTTEYASFNPAMYTVCKAQCDSVKMELQKVHMFVTAGVNREKMRNWCKVTVTCDCERIENKQFTKVTISPDDGMVFSSGQADFFGNDPRKLCLE